MNVLFPDPFIITLVAAVRALGRRGDTCHVAWPYGFAKRLCKSRFVKSVSPTAARSSDPDQFAKDVVSLCRAGDYDVVLPVSIESTEALLPYRRELSGHVATLLPTAEQLRLGSDKAQTLDVCKRLDILHPETWIVEDSQALDQLAANVDYPVVVKHTRNFGGSRGVRFAGNADELRTAHADLQRLTGGECVILVQEHVPGLLFDAMAVAVDGHCPRIFTSARKLMYPVSGGVTCICVSTNTPKLKDTAERILTALRWNGPVELEFKLDERDGEFKLIEINPRFWGSLGSAIKCGVNFPAIAVDLALGREVAQTREHEVGVRHKFMIGRLPYGYWQLARARGLGALRDRQQYRRTTFDIDWADPMPNVFDSLQIARNLLVGRFPKRLTAGAQQMIHGLENPVPYA